MSDYAAIEKEARIFTEECVTNNRIDPTLFAQYDIKRGLRDKNGKGVLAGITNISRIDAFEERDGQKVPCEGKLWYRGYNVYDLIRGLRGKRYAFEGAAYLLLLGDLPDAAQLESFNSCLTKCRALPTNFVRDVIMKAPSHDLMNSLTRSVLTLASYDDDIGKTDLQTQLEQCIKLISVFPMLAVYGYHAYNYYECGGSMYIHRPDPSLSTAENLLKMLRPDQNVHRPRGPRAGHCPAAAHGARRRQQLDLHDPRRHLVRVGHLLRHRGGAFQPEGPQARRREHQGHADDGRHPRPRHRPAGRGGHG